MGKKFTAALLEVYIRTRTLQDGFTCMHAVRNTEKAHKQIDRYVIIVFPVFHNFFQNEEEHVVCFLSVTLKNVNYMYKLTSMNLFHLFGLMACYNLLP